MVNIGFVNQVSNHQNATHEAIGSIRRFYPDAPIVLSVDGVENWKHNAYFVDGYKLDQNLEVVFNKQRLGYPPYDLDNFIEWMTRMHYAVSRLSTEYFMMLEDDVWLLNEIQLSVNGDYFGHVIEGGNYFPELIMRFVRDSGFIGRNNVNYYAAGGGTIFKRFMFTEYYQEVMYDLIVPMWPELTELYWPQIGYMDCYMMLFYMIVGAEYVPNRRMKNLDPHNPVEAQLSREISYDQAVKVYGKDYDLIHNVKRYY